MKTPSACSSALIWFISSLLCPVRRRSVQTRVHRGSEGRLGGVGLQRQVQQETRHRGELDSAFVGLIRERKSVKCNKSQSGVVSEMVTDGPQNTKQTNFIKLLIFLPLTYLRGGVDDFVCLWCLQLKTRQGTELLIQSENDVLVNEWYRALQDTISTHVRTNTFMSP